MLRSDQDAYGHAIADYLRGQPATEIVEREDGLITNSIGAFAYFAPYERWSDYERKAIRFAHGRVLDVGCGAGRVLLHLQERGLECVGIDNSPLAVKVCKERGCRHVRGASVTEVNRRWGVFDTIVMFGNNFGLFGSYKRARWLLRRFNTITSPKALIIAASTDPYDTNEPEHTWYHRHNRRRGRMGGQLRLRVRHMKYRTPWFDYLLVSVTEMRALLAGTGWRIARIIESPGPSYAAVIEKSGSDSN